MGGQKHCSGTSTANLYKVKSCRFFGDVRLDLRPFIQGYTMATMHYSISLLLDVDLFDGARCDLDAFLKDHPCLLELKFD